MDIQRHYRLAGQPSSDRQTPASPRLRLSTVTAAERVRPALPKPSPRPAPHRQQRSCARRHSLVKIFPDRQSWTSSLRQSRFRRNYTSLRLTQVSVTSTRWRISSRCCIYVACNWTDMHHTRPAVAWVVPAALVDITPLKRSPRNCRRSRRDRSRHPRYLGLGQ